MATTRPLALINSQGLTIIQSFADLAFLGDDLGGANVIYAGYAIPGSSTSEPVWQIRRFTYNASNNIIAAQWPENANGIVSNDYKFIWDDRAILVYV